MELRDILKELQKMLHNPYYSDKDKYNIVKAHNSLMEVYENEGQQNQSK